MEREHCSAERSWQQDEKWGGPPLSSQSWYESRISSSACSWSRNVSSSAVSSGLLACAGQGKAGGEGTPWHCKPQAEWRRPLRRPYHKQSLAQAGPM